MEWTYAWLLVFGLVSGVIFLLDGGVCARSISKVKVVFSCDVLSFITVFHAPGSLWVSSWLPKLLGCSIAPLITVYCWCSIWATVCIQSKSIAYLVMFTKWFGVFFVITYCATVFFFTYLYFSISLAYVAFITIFAYYLTSCFSSEIFAFGIILETFSLILW